MKILPLFDRVVLQPKKDDTHGFYMPDDDKEPIIAVVVACGPGVDNQGMSVKEGDQVLYNSFACNYFEINHEQYILIKQKDILAIIS